MISFKFLKAFSSKQSGLCTVLVIHASFIGKAESWIPLYLSSLSFLLQPPRPPPFSFGFARGLLDLQATQRKVVISFLLSLPFPALGRIGSQGWQETLLAETHLLIEAFDFKIS